MAGGRRGWPARVLSRRVPVLAAMLASIAASTFLAACSQATPPPPSGPTVETVQAHTVAGTILRIIKGQASGDLRISEESGPDAPGPPYPACLTKHSHRQRVVNFDINWAGINWTTDAAPAVTITITGPDGSALIANEPRANPPDLCRTVREFVLGAEGKGWQLVYGLALKESSHAKLPPYLWVTVDGHVKKIRLSRVCNQSNCFQDDPPVNWQAGTSYSPELII